MKIKICGITNVSDARCAIENGADLIGFVFYPKSPRYVPPEKVRDIIKKLPNEAATVGVFVNETTQNMTSISRYCPLSALQLHGQESLLQLTELKGIDLIKAFAPKSEQDLLDLYKFRKYTLLIDSPSDEHGGSGRKGNWELARKASLSYRIFLAGGLTPDNVLDAIRLVAPYGVDISSGVEKEKGLKDPEKIRKFIETARKIGSSQNG